MLVSCVCYIKLFTPAGLPLSCSCAHFVRWVLTELCELLELMSCCSHLAGKQFTNWFVIPLQFATIMITLATCGILGGQALQVTHPALLNAEPTIMSLPTPRPPSRNPPACQVHGVSAHLGKQLTSIAPSECWQKGAECWQKG